MIAGGASSARPAAGRLRVVGALVLAALGVGAWWLAGRTTGASRPPSHAGEARAPLRLRIMTFNLRWDGFEDHQNSWSHRRAIACRVIGAFDPDSVGTQEPMIRQIRDVVAALPRLDSYRFDNDPHFVRTQQILYRKDRFERVDGGGFLVAEGTNENGTIRFCTWVRLRERETGRCYEHYNVHLDHRSAASRRASVVRLMRHVAARTPADPFVITGDFNTREGSPEIAYLKGKGTLPDPGGGPATNPIPLVDAFRALHPDAKHVGTAGGFHGRETGPMIDHVFVAAGAAKVLEAGIVRTNQDGHYPSDHFPVTAVVELEAREAHDAR